MTACKDSLNGKKAVSATLAGVLAVGMVPAAAFAATDQADTQDEAGISLQLSTAESQFMAGSVHEITVGNTATTDVANVTVKSTEYGTAAGKKAVTITQVLPQDSDAAVDVDTDSYKQVFLTEATAATATVKIAGTYYTMATSDASTAAGTRTIAIVPKSFNAATVGQVVDANTLDKAPMATFKVVSASLEGAYVTTATDGKYPEKDLALDGITKWQDLKVSADGETAVTPTKITKADGSNVAIGDTNITPGSYVATATDADGKAVDVAFTVAKMDLATAGLKTADVAGDAAAPVFSSITLANGTAFGTSTVTEASDFTLNYSPIDSASANGTYTITLTPASDKAKALFDGEAEITYNRTADVSVSGFKYGDVVMTDGQYYKADVNATANDLTKAGTSADTAKVLKGAFDASKLTMTYTKPSTGKEVTLDNSDLVVTYYDADNNKAVDAPAAKGNYIVTVKVDPSKVNYEVNGSKTFHVAVQAGDVASADVTVKYGDALLSSTAKQVTYTGEDVMGNISTIVRDSNGNVLTEGTDYKVKVTKDGKEVDEIVNKGTYTIEVTSDSYAIDGTQQAKVEIAPITVSTLTVDGLVKYVSGYTTATEDAPSEAIYSEFMPYTGEAIVPVLKYTATDADGNAIKGTLPAEVYIASYQYAKPKSTTFAKATEVKDEGTYKMSVKSSDAEVAENYVLTGATISDFSVEKKKVFADVATTDWFFSEVYKAQDNGYVKGIGGTELYAPYASMTRADVCVVLLRMAGGDLDYNTDGSVNTTKGYNTKFSDVDAHAYYAKAIQWASNAGIVTGFDGTDEFAPEQSVTRDQFAAMLARYAKATGADITADASAIDGYADASAVESWATPYVAWAVEAGVMGQNTDVLSPVKEVSRAEVAAMAVRYQPKAITTDLIK